MGRTCAESSSSGPPLSRDRPISPQYFTPGLSSWQHLTRASLRSVEETVVAICARHPAALSREVSELPAGVSSWLTIGETAGSPCAIRLPPPPPGGGFGGSPPLFPSP